MNYNDYLNQIIAFNGDKEVISLREKFNIPSFFEIISKERSETTYSAFLRWLFQENGLNSETCNPLLLLLDILAQRSEEQKELINSILNDDCIKRNVVTRNVIIKSVKVETEKPVSALAEKILAKPYNPTLYAEYNQGELSIDDLRKIAAKSKDRIDLFIDCEVECKCFTAKRLQIFIENKIDSLEGGKKQIKVTGVKDYDEASQTERYYLATKYSTVDNGKAIDGRDTLQVYVYLTPQAPKPDICTDKHFVQISYQDIVDGILTPMLASCALSSRSRFFLEEFHNQLVFPSLDGTEVYPSIAMGKENSKEFTNVWKKYKLLLTHAAIVASETNLWMIDEVYYDHQPRTELLDLLLAKGVQSEDIVDGQWKQRIPYAKIKNLAAEYGIETDQVDLKLDDDTTGLLSSFWDKNKRLLTALINGLEDDEQIKVEALLSQMSKRDATRYNVYYGDKKLNEKPLGKAMTAFSIIKLWTNTQKAEGKDVTIDILNRTFPRKYNPYYENGKWFKHLFYEESNCYNYDGEKAEGPVQGGWDFDKKGRFTIDTTDGKKATMLKMWRKDALENLIKIVEEQRLFDEPFNIVPIE